MLSDWINRIPVDVPKDSAYALIYNLALAVGTWDHPLLEGVTPLAGHDRGSYVALVAKKVCAD